MMKMVLLSIAGRKYSLPVEQILHILPAPELFPLVRLRDEISGVFLYGDEPIPMLKPSELAGMSHDTGAGEYVLVFQSEYGNVGLPVDSAVTIVDVEAGFFEVADPDSPDQDAQVFSFQEVSYPLLDIEAKLAQLPN